MKTLLETVQATAAYFEKHGVENARLNAELLLAHLLGRRRLDLYLEFDRPLDETCLERLREPVRQRAHGVPLQYLIGTVEFFGREFKCDRRALIPRPETEQLCELLLTRLATDSSNARVLDVGTGSGVIALTLAAGCPSAEVHATDSSAVALELARENAARLGLAERVRFHHGDLFADAPGLFDLVVANLPYVAQGEMPALAPELAHEPADALIGGVRGTEIVECLIAAAPPHLAPGGLLALEIGAGQRDYLIEKLRATGYHHPESKADYQGHDRFLLANYG